MIEANYKKIKAWPFKEAIRIKNIISRISNKKTVIFETGYGPSGDPHIGTFAEVLRTNMVRNCFNEISDLSTDLITFSDDLDALRKVPDDYPYPEQLNNFLDCPLSSIPDFTNKYESYADRNNNLLKDFLDKFDFKYKFISSTDCYKSGNFDQQLKKVLENYEQIINLILPTLRKERRQSYSPFLPICNKTNKVLQVPIKIIDKTNGIIAYKENNKYKDVLVTGGNCKLQWKVDWAMRWSALNIDYEMNGKDLIPSFELSKKIANFIGKKVPVNMSYELFLDEKGEKISKSKGNGLSIDEWLKFGTSDSLSLFMYHNPKRAKRLFFDCIPKSMDEYRKLFDDINNISNDDYNNPLWHIHQKNPPKFTYPIEFSTLLNLVTALNSTNNNTIKDFVKIYIGKSINQKVEKELDKIIKYSLEYYKNFIMPNIKKREPNDLEKKAILQLIDEIKNLNKNSSAEDYQKVIYNIGKNAFPNDLRKWFVSLYQILFGSDNGPRLGSFFNVYGKGNVILMLEKVVMKNYTK